MSKGVSETCLTPPPQQNSKPPATRPVMPVLCVWVYGWLVEIERYGRERDRSIDRRSGLAAVMVCRFEWGGRDGPSSPAALVRYARSANNGANESIHPIGYSHPPTNKQASGFGALLLSSKGDRSTDCWADSINRFIAQKITRPFRPTKQPKRVLASRAR